MPLQRYRAMRRFAETPEPRGTRAPKGTALAFVVQKHAASRLHYDFRLQVGDVLASWAVPKGPSTTPGEKRLAVHVEDHPIEYGKFEGVIPKGQYGAGTVEIWDKGTWVPEGDPKRGLRAGNLKFQLKGRKLKGGWALVRMAPKDDEKGKENWLLIKHDDGKAGPGGSATKKKPATARATRKSGGRPRATDRTSTTAASATVPTPPPGARRAALPRRLLPQLAQLVDAPPTGDAWIHEIKFDGYRFLARIDRGRVQLLSRNGKAWTGSFPDIEAALAALPVTNAWLDGELVAIGPDGRHSFQELQRVLKTGKGELVYYIFDCLHLDGFSLVGAPLLYRKQVLAPLLAGGNDSPLRYSDHVEGAGFDTWQQACRLRLEGIVSKRKDGTYRPGRGADWQKTKCQSRQEFIIGGYTDPTGGRIGFGALLIGVRDADGRLKPAGRVGTGFDGALLADLHRRLQALEIDESPFDPSPAGARARGVHWVKPVLVAEVEFTEWTSEGQLRHPSFQGLREDKPAAEVTREVPKRRNRVTRAAERTAAPRKTAARQATPKATPRAARTTKAGATGVALTHPDRVVYDTMGLTKADLAAYYEAVAPHMLPHVSHRPLALVRCPGGEGKGCFYQKHLGPGAPKAIRAIRIEETSTSGEYPWVRDAAGLVGLVQMGVLEIHPWGSRVDDIERPDRLVFDIDPDPKLAWSRVAALAFKLRERLEELGLESWLKTTGGKGVHVVVPIQRRHEWPLVKAFCEAVAVEMARRFPDEVTSVMSKAKRVGRIFLDYLRNGRGATAIAAYSTRARPGAPVATPIAWEELARLGRADSFNVKTLPKRLALLTHDPWAKLAASRQGLSQKVLAGLAID